MREKEAHHSSISSTASLYAELALELTTLSLRSSSLPGAVLGAPPGPTLPFGEALPNPPGMSGIGGGAALLLNFVMSPPTLSMLADDDEGRPA